MRPVVQLAGSGQPGGGPRTSQGNSHGDSQGHSRGPPRERRGQAYHRRAGRYDPLWDAPQGRGGDRAAGRDPGRYRGRGQPPATWGEIVLQDDPYAAPAESSADASPYAAAVCAGAVSPQNLITVGLQSAPAAPLGAAIELLAIQCLDRIVAALEHRGWEEQARRMQSQEAAGTAGEAVAALGELCASIDRLFSPGEAGRPGDGVGGPRLPILDGYLR